MIITQDRLNRLLKKVDKAVKKALKQANANPMEGAFVMEAYSEYLDDDFQKQMTKAYGIEYPLNAVMKQVG